MNAINVELNINTLRMLSRDNVEKAKSGHPSLPSGGTAIVPLGKEFAMFAMGGLK